MFRSNIRTHYFSLKNEVFEIPLLPTKHFCKYMNQFAKTKYQLKRITEWIRKIVNELNITLQNIAVWFDFPYRKIIPKHIRSTFSEKTFNLFTSIEAPVQTSLFTLCKMKIVEMHCPWNDIVKPLEFINYIVVFEVQSFDT